MWVSVQHLGVQTTDFLSDCALAQLVAAGFVSSGPASFLAQLEPFALGELRNCQPDCEMETRTGMGDLRVVE